MLQLWPLQRLLLVRVGLLQVPQGQELRLLGLELLRLQVQALALLPQAQVQAREVLLELLELVQVGVDSPEVALLEEELRAVGL